MYVTDDHSLRGLQPRAARCGINSHTIWSERGHGGYTPRFARDARHFLADALLWPCLVVRVFRGPLRDRVHPFFEDAGSLAFLAERRRSDVVRRGLCCAGLGRDGRGAGGRGNIAGSFEGLPFSGWRAGRCRFCLVRRCSSSIWCERCRGWCIPEAAQAFGRSIARSRSPSALLRAGFRPAYPITDSRRRWGPRRRSSVERVNVSVQWHNYFAYYNFLPSSSDDSSRVSDGNWAYRSSLERRRISQSIAATSSEEAWAVQETPSVLTDGLPSLLRLGGSLCVRPNFARVRVDQCCRRDPHQMHGRKPTLALTAIPTWRCSAIRTPKREGTSR